MADSSKHKFGKSIYDMELNEELIADPIIAKLSSGSEFECLPLRILRVPGGWIYYNLYASSAGVFVPFDNEFQRINNELMYNPCSDVILDTTFNPWCETTKEEIDNAMLMPGEYVEKDGKFYIKRGMLDGYIDYN